MHPSDLTSRHLNTNVRPSFFWWNELEAIEGNMILIIFFKNLQDVYMGFFFSGQKVQFHIFLLFN
jgi:hypothetical protein